LIETLKEICAEDCNAKAGILFVGATGGVRSALSQGLLTEDDLTSFEKRLVEGLSEVKNIKEVRFSAIDGSDEGRWELMAAQAIWSGDSGTMFGVEDAFVGMISGGGSSMQIGAEGGEAVSHAFSTMWDGMEEGKGAPAEAWLDDAVWGAWEADLIEKIEQYKASQGEAFRLLDGCYVGTACNKQAVAAAGFADRPVTAEEAIPLLRAGVLEFRTQTGPNYEREKDVQRPKVRYNWFSVMARQKCRLAHVLEILFDPTARLYFTKTGLTKTTEQLDCEWTLGAWTELHAVHHS